MEDRISKVLVVIPAFNEAASIKTTLKSLSEAGSNFDVLVINDGSDDQTAQYVKECGVKVISLPFNVGIGGAVSTGFLYAKRKGYNVVLRLDADGQHDVLSIQDVLRPVLNGEADLCIGSRFKDGQGAYRSSFLRRVGIHFFSGLIGFLIGEAVTDPTSGFCAFSAKAVNLFMDHYPPDYPEPEAIVIAKRAGLSVMEVLVVMKKREAGKSSIRYLKTLYYMIKVTLAIVLNYLRPVKVIK